nr:MAG TPA: hypothetical protein [Caudoviricetes sp.]
MVVTSILCRRLSASVFAASCANIDAHSNLPVRC